MLSSQKQLVKSLQDYFHNQPVLKVYLFGSFARNNEIKSSSDVDLLIEFDPSIPIGLEFCQMYLDLKEITGREVDLVTQEALSKYIAPFVEKEKVLIYERAA